MAQYDDLHTGTITLVGVVSAILTFVIIAAAQVLYYQYQEVETARKEIDVPITASDNVILEQEAILSNYGWLDQEKGIVGLPIDRAMQDVLAELGSGSKAEASN
ncbi:hypothetical protein [Rubinisphaera sp. JC750]|uniref:hypothetical protein n=1 Tax=Rubinisphaera sp. JC750 TaxID=2898658 RepID=UPI001F380E39|nr:hypothetical protein [Rubinisphaera sp. JC750]